MTLDERFGDALAPDRRAVQENFHRWFKKSAVVDDAGDPLVVYHGTLNVFNEFKLGHGEAQSRGFFFTNQANMDFYLAGYLDRLKYQSEERPGDYIVMPVFLSLQNPMRVNTTATGHWADPDSENATIAEAKARGHDGVIFTDDDEETVFYVAFKATQIKSAIGNSGLFALHSKRLCDEIDLVPHMALVQAQKAHAWIESLNLSSHIDFPRHELGCPRVG